MKIEVLGSGCANCKRLEQSTREAVAALGIDAEVVKVEDWDSIMGYGITATPALALDGAVISSGRVLSTDEVKGLLAKTGD